MFSEIINPFLTVRNQFKNNSGQWVDEQKTETRERLRMASSETITLNNDEIHTVFTNWNNKIIIDSLTYAGTDGVQPQLFIDRSAIPYDSQLFHTVIGHTIIPITGGAHNVGRTATPQSYIEEFGNDYFDITTKYTEDDTTYYIVQLKKPIILPEGGRLQFRGVPSILRLGVSGSLSYKVVYREIEEVTL